MKNVLFTFAMLTFGVGMFAQTSTHDADAGPWHGLVINNPGHKQVLTKEYIVKYYESQGQWDSLNLYTPKGATAAAKTKTFQRNLKGEINAWKVELDWRGNEIQQKYNITLPKTIDLKFVIDRYKEMKPGYKKWSNPEKGSGIYEMQTSAISDSGALKYYDRKPYDIGGNGEPVLYWYDIAKKSLVCGNDLKDFTVSFTTARYTDPGVVNKAVEQYTTYQAPMQPGVYQQPVIQYLSQPCPTNTCYNPVYLNNFYGCSQQQYYGTQQSYCGFGIFFSFGIYASGGSYCYDCYQPYYGQQTGDTYNYYYSYSSTDNSIHDSFNDNSTTTTYNGPRPIRPKPIITVPDITNGEGDTIVVGDPDTTGVPDVHNLEKGVNGFAQNVDASSAKTGNTNISTSTAWGTPVGMQGFDQLNTDLGIAMANASTTWGNTSTGNGLNVNQVVGQINNPTNVTWDNNESGNGLNVNQNVEQSISAISATWGGGDDGNGFTTNQNVGQLGATTDATWGNTSAGNGFNVNQTVSQSSTAQNATWGGNSPQISTDVNQQYGYQNLSSTWGSGTGPGGFVNTNNFGTQFQASAFATWNNSGTFNNTGFGTAFDGNGVAWSNNTFGTNINNPWSGNYYGTPQNVSFNGGGNGYFNPSYYQANNNYYNGGTLQTNNISGGFGGYGYNPYLLSNTNTTTGFTYNGPTKNTFTYTSGAGQTNSALSYNAPYKNGTKGSIFSGTGGSGKGGTMLLKSSFGN